MEKCGGCFSFQLTGKVHLDTVSALLHLPQLTGMQYHQYSHLPVSTGPTEQTCYETCLSICPGKLQNHTEQKSSCIKVPLLWEKASASLPLEETVSLHSLCFKRRYSHKGFFGTSSAPFSTRMSGPVPIRGASGASCSDGAVGVEKEGSPGCCPSSPFPAGPAQKEQGEPSRNDGTTLIARCFDCAALQR